MVKNLNKIRNLETKAENLNNVNYELVDYETASSHDISQYAILGISLICFILIMVIRNYKRNNKDQKLDIKS